jgi:hypothetical protein
MIRESIPKLFDAISVQRRPDCKESTIELYSYRARTRFVFVFSLQKMYSCLHTTRVRIAFPARGNPSRQHKSTGKPEILLSAASSKKIKVQKGTIQPQTQ